MRPGLLTACLLVVTLSASAAPLEPIEPVAPDKEIPADILEIFNDFFGEQVRAAQATSATADDAAVVDRIFQEARKRIDYPAFCAYALDQVVRLGSICPDRQRVVYMALKVQKQAPLRNPEACLEKMMTVAPRVAGELQGQDFATWLGGEWAPDALELVKRRVAEMDYEAAMATSTRD